MGNSTVPYYIHCQPNRERVCVVVCYFLLVEFNEKKGKQFQRDLCTFYKRQIEGEKKNKKHKFSKTETKERAL